MPPRQNTDPPLDRPKQVAANVWIVDSGPMMAMGILPLPVRMTIARLADGGLWVHSPTRFFAMLLRQREELGPIRHFVAPNSAHRTFLGEWQTYVPGATTWHDDIERIVVDGGGFYEMCFFHRPYAAFLPRTKKPGCEQPGFGNSREAEPSISP